MDLVRACETGVFILAAPMDLVRACETGVDSAEVSAEMGDLKRVDALKRVGNFFLKPGSEGGSF